MSSLERYGEVFTSDVLILGGGVSGLILANRLKELNCDLDIVIVEKATTGFSGSKANKGAGVLWVMDKTDDMEKFLEYYVQEVGYYLEDQEIVRLFAESSLPLVEHFERWDVEIYREADGGLARIEEIPLWALCAYDIDILMKLRKRARQNKVKMIDKTQSVELLTDGNRVTGAVGFNLTNGEYKIFKSKATVIANGACNWMATNMWYSGRGDGIAASYRAGAEMRNAEFSNFYNLGLRGNSCAIVGGQYALYNALGEYISPRYTKEFEYDFDINIFLGMEDEVKAGRGPILFEETELFVKNPIAAGGFLFKWDRPQAGRFWRLLMEKENRFSSDRGWRKEVIPQFIGEMACINVDHQMRGTLEGMWALGDACKTGSAFSGATPPPCRLRGSGLTWAGVSSLLAENSIVEYVAETNEPVVDTDQVARYKDEIMSPLLRKSGLCPREGIRMLQEVVTPPRYSVRKSKDRMQEALKVVNHLYTLVDTEIAPADFHMLGLHHDLRNMTTCTDLYMNASLTREESRGWHVREDFAGQDNQKWRKWIIQKMEHDQMHISTREIPFERYKYNP